MHSVGAGFKGCDNMTLTHKKQEHGKLIGLGGPYGGDQTSDFW